MGGGEGVARGGGGGVVVRTGLLGTWKYMYTLCSPFIASILV